MTAQKYNRPKLKIWLPLVAGAVLTSGIVFTALRQSALEQPSAEHPLSALLDTNKGPSIHSISGGSGESPLKWSGGEIQQADSLYDQPPKAPLPAVAFVSDLQSARASHAQTFANSDADIIDDGPREIAMEPAVATVTLEGISHQLEPNAIGCFPRMLIAAEGHASVLLSYPNAKSGDQLVIQCEDGGTLDNGLIVRRAEVDGAGRISFEFNAGVPEGIYRIVLRKGLDEKRLEFWAGQELPLKPVAQSN